MFCTLGSGSDEVEDEVEDEEDLLGLLRLLTFLFPYSV